jgi:hypothetical protein
MFARKPVNKVKNRYGNIVACKYYIKNGCKWEVKVVPVMRSICRGINDIENGKKMRKKGETKF